MAWSFRKRVKIVPGVHLNFSKNGISTSVGVRGASLTFGKSGTYLNTSVPVLGIQQRQRLNGPKARLNSSTVNLHQLQEQQSDNIFSADVQEITSQSMQGIKESIILAQEQRKELKDDLLKIRTTLAASKLKLSLSYIFVYGFLKKKIPQSLKIDIEAQKEAIEQTREQIEKCFVKLDIDFDPYIKEKYNKLIDSFRKLINCHKIWDVTSAHYQDRVATRSSAGTIVRKREVKFAFKSLPDIKSDIEPLYFQNANGADLYFYPTFIIMYSSKTSFAIIGFDEINFAHSFVRFTETGSVPRDSKIIDKTWAKVNKNGTRDKRFKGNYQIPVVRYGEIRLKTTNGLNEEYEFSNYESSAEFAQIFKEYQHMIKSLTK